MGHVEHPVALALERPEPGHDGALVHERRGLLLVEEARVDDVVRGLDENVAFMHDDVAVVGVG